MDDVVIVGAGLAGLVAADALRRRGLRVRVLEAAARCGGRIAGVRYEDGRAGERGMHELWVGDPTLDYARDLPLSQPEDAWSSVVIDGRLHPHTEDFLASLFDAEEQRALELWLAWCDVLATEARAHRLTSRTAPLQEMSFAAWVMSCAVPRRVAELIRLTVECEVGTDWEAISALYGVQQMRVFLPSTRTLARASCSPRLSSALLAHAPVRARARSRGAVRA